MCKPFWLFNVARIEGLPESLYAATIAPVTSFNPIEEAEILLSASGADIAHGFDGAFISARLPTERNDDASN
jgi:antirestriction protein ArdC